MLTTITITKEVILSLSFKICWNGQMLKTFTKTATWSLQWPFPFNWIFPSMLCLTFLNPNISMHILHTVLYTFLMVLTRRICLTISLHILHTVLHTFPKSLTRRICLTISLHILHTVLHTFPKSLTRRICLTISLHILHTVLHTFLMVLIRRIRPTIKNSSSWWSFSLFSWP